jgi:hypothetical protein
VGLETKSSEADRIHRDYPNEFDAGVPLMAYEAKLAKDKDEDR